MAYFSRTQAKITPENRGERIKSITVRICITDCTGEFYVTDILLQGGFCCNGMGWASFGTEVDFRWLSLYGLRKS